MPPSSTTAGRCAWWPTSGKGPRTRSGSSSAARSAPRGAVPATSSISARARPSTARRPRSAPRCGGSASRGCPTTRILSRFRVLVDGLEPRAIGLHADDSAATFEYEAGALRVTRVRFIDAGLHERITLTNPGDTMVDAVLEIEVAADFAAMLGIR